MKNPAPVITSLVVSMLVVAAICTGSSPTGPWTPYPIYRGEITSVAVDPSTPATVYAGTRDAGVFKSIDGGDTWVPARTGLTFLPIRSLAIDPLTPTTIYAGTDFAGVWKSTNGGGTWTSAAAGLDLDLIVLVLLVDPTDPDNLLAGCAGGIGLAVGNVFRSTDGGTSWVRSDSGIPGASPDHSNGVRAMALDPVNPDVAYVGTTFEGAFRSTNGGITWSALTTGLPSDSGYHKKVDAIATDPHDDHRPYAVVEGLVGGGLYRLDDENQWQLVSDTYELSGGSHLHFHPVDQDTLLVSGGLGGQVTLSIDDGLTWEQIFGHPESGTVSAIAWHDSLPSRLFAAADVSATATAGGVFRSTDGGSTWALTSNGITAAVVRAVATSPHDPARLYVGTGNGALLVSADSGASWQPAHRASNPSSHSLGPSVTDILVDPVDPDRVYVAAGALHLSANGGTTITSENLVDDATCLAAAADGSGTIWVGTSFGRGIARGSSTGPWTAMNSGLPSFGGSLCPILSLATDPHDPQTVWAGTQYGGGIVKTADGGSSWHVMGLTDANFVDAIAVSPADSDLVLAGAGYSEGGIHRSTDGGGTWTQVAGGIGFVQDFVFHPHDPAVVFAATEGSGVLRSADGGLSWTDFSDGVFYPVLYSIASDRDHEPPRLITGSYGAGAWHREIESLALIFADDFELGSLGAWSASTLP